MGDRGQLYTLEGITAGVIVVLGLFFALQATTATPGAAGSLNPHAEQQDRATVQGVLNAVDDTQLRQAVLFWGPDGFHCTPDGREFYPGSVAHGECDLTDSDQNGDRLPPNEFGRVLEQRLGAAYDYNVFVTYTDETESLDRQRMVYQGQPGSGAVSASTTLVLTNYQQLYDDEDSANSPTGDELRDDPDAFYAPPSTDGDAGDDDLYNVLYVEVVAWR